MTIEEMAIELTKSIITSEDVTGTESAKAKKVTKLFFAVLKELQSNASNK